MGFEKIELIGKIDPISLIFYNLLGAGEDCDSDIKFRRKIQYCLNLLSGHVFEKEQEEDWEVKVVEKVKKRIDNHFKNVLGTQDDDFLFHSFLAEEIIKKLSEEKMIKEKKLEEGVMA